MWISALVTSANWLLALVIGIRLLRRSGSGPEVWLSLYFLLAAFLGTAVNSTAYASATGAGLDLPAAFVPPMLAVSALGAALGSAGVLMFTWRTFRPDAGWAKGLVALSLLLYATGYVGHWLTEGWAIRIVPGPAYWLGRIAFFFPFVWISIETLRYYGLARRRVAIGLADPLTTNRFLLWGIWSLATIANASAEIGARILYVWKTGETTQLLIDEARPIVIAAVAISSVVGIVSATTLLLTFFPTERYRRWIESRVAATPA